MLRLPLILMLVALGLGARLPAFAADAFPNRPIRVIVPGGTGGGLDMILRAMGPKLGDALGQSVVVDNRAGGGGSIGVELAVRAPADGHTLLFASATFLIHPLLVKARYDPIADLEPVSQIAAAPYLLVVSSKTPAKSVRELIALSRTQALDFGSPGTGTLAHLTNELLRSVTRINLVNVSYKGMGSLLIDVLSGQINAAFSSITGALPHVRAQKMRALAITTAQRHAAAPSVPTMAEAGVADFVVTQWHGMLVPARTPKPVIERIHRELELAAKDPEFARRLAIEGTDVVANTPTQFQAHIHAERSRWANVIQKANIRAD